MPDFGEVPRVTTSRATTRIEFPISLPSARENDAPSHGNSTSYGLVYGNELASTAHGEMPRVFPVGSILVREKLSQPDSSEPELLTVMIKREKDFNPASGDWLFLTVSGNGSKVKERTKKGACLDCHQSARDQDFVFGIK